MAKKQVEFQKNQTHNKNFEMAVLAFSVACIIFVIIAIQTVGGGGV